MKKKNILIIMPFIGLVLFFSLAGIFMEDKGYSPEESRALRTWDQLDLKDRSSLGEQLEDYLVDQFPYRGDFLLAYSKKDQALGKYFTRSVYVSPDDWIFSEASQEDMEAVSRHLPKLLERYGDRDFYYAIVPSKNLALAEKYAFTGNDVAWANYHRLRENLEALEGDNFQILDLIPQSEDRDFLNDEAKWYRTDSHWNALGAMTGLDQILVQMRDLGGLDRLRDPDNLELKYVEDGLYLGNLNKRFSYIYGEEGPANYLEPVDQEGYSYYLDEEEDQELPRGEILARDLGQEEFTYEGIYTLNLPYYKVVNEKAANDETILIIKDSMQNPGVDIFTETFSQVKVVDPRFIEDYSLDDLMVDVDKVLFLFHQNHNVEEVGDFIK